jgi:hypothetical protein
MPAMRYAKIVTTFGAVVLVSVVGTLTALAFFLHLLQRSWDAMIRATGTTTLGLFVYVILLTALLSWAVVVVEKWVRLTQAHTNQPLREALRESRLLGALIGGGLALIMLSTFAVFLSATILHDHEILSTTVRTLTNDNAKLKAEVETRRHNIFMTDPVFSDVTHLLLAFDAYRHALKGEPCVLKVTAPSDSGPLASVVPQLSNWVSDCFTFGPMPSTIDPDVETETMTGMVPGTIIFHASKDDTAANQLFDGLSSLVKLKRSYQPPRVDYQLPPNARSPHVVWLQFGTKTVWNSELPR